MSRPVQASAHVLAERATTDAQPKQCDVAVRWQKAAHGPMTDREEGALMYGHRQGWLDALSELDKRGILNAKAAAD